MNTKSVFHFDPKTREFLGESFAMQSPLQPGHYLLPSNATFDTPPACAANEVAVLIDGIWERRPDWRKTKLYSILDGSEVVIDKIGVTPADVDATDLQRPDEGHAWKKGKWIADAGLQEKVLARKQNQKWAAIKAERDRRINSGGYRVGDKWYHSDQISRVQQQNLFLMGDAIPSNLQWKTMDGSFVTMTLELTKQILAAASASDQAIFTAAESHKAAMLAASDPLAYDFSQGWPDQYSIV